jgi:hypothetical protein
LTTAQSTFSDKRCTAPDSGWRTTSTSGCIAFNVIAVSIRVSPLTIELERGAGARRALEKAVDDCAAAQRAAFLVGLPVELNIAVGQVEDVVISSGDRPSIPSRWRCGNGASAAPLCMSPGL